jgi:hypothetical protein
MKSILCIFVVVSELLSGQILLPSLAQALDSSCVSAQATTTVTISGNLSSTASTISAGSIPTVSAAGAATSITTFANLNSVAEYSTIVEIIDSLGSAHNLAFYFFHIGANSYQVRAYVNSDEVDPGASPSVGLPRLIGAATLLFGIDGSRSNPPTQGQSDFAPDIPWFNGADQTQTISTTFSQIAMSPSASGITQVVKDGAATHSTGQPVVLPTYTSQADDIQVFVSANISASDSVLPGGAGDIPIDSPAGFTTSTTTFADLGAESSFDLQVSIRDNQGVSHDVRFFFFHVSSGAYYANGYAYSQDVDPGLNPIVGLPRLIGSVDLPFGTDGTRTDLPLLDGNYDILASIPWNNGSTASSVGIVFNPVTSLAGSSIFCDQTVRYSSSCGGSGPGIDSDADGIFDCADLCPADAHKTTPGTCGCGNVDSDLNDNGVVDCLDPTAHTVPVLPTIHVTKRTVKISMQNFLGHLVYIVNVQRGSYRHTYYSASKSVQLRNLAKGTWRVKYRIRLGPPSNRIVSKFSTSANFQIR